MLTLGIDLATVPKKTGACQVEWGHHSARVTFVRVGWSDDELLAAIDEADWVGIDAPFGWPVGFVAAMRGYAERRVWPGDGREPLRLRATDRFVREQTGLTPMSVSADRIGATAMRCASLLTRVGETRGAPVDLVGADKIVEVYPAAALKVWAADAPDLEIVWTGYKGRHGQAGRDVIIRALTQAVASLTLSETDLDLCRRNDDALDSLVCSLLARAASSGLTHQPDRNPRADATSEGWIHFPVPDRLAGLR